MKLVTAVTFVALCAALGVSETATAADVPQDGVVTTKDRKRRVNEVLVRRNTSPRAQFEANARTGRGARHSCIADFKALCLQEDGKPLNKKQIEEAGAQQKQKEAAENDGAEHGDEDAKAETDSRRMQAQGEQPPDRVSNFLRSSSRKQRLALRGMERCLSTRIDEIEDAKCKEFIVSRNQCFSEAESLCSEKVAEADRKEEAAVNAPKSVADAVVNEKALKKDKSVSSNVANVGIGKQLTTAQLAELRADFTRISCLRKADPAQLTASCVNSSYYESLRIMKGKRSGIRAKLADKILGAKKKEDKVKQ